MERGHSSRLTPEIPQFGVCAGLVGLRLWLIDLVQKTNNHAAAQQVSSDLGSAPGPTASVKRARYKVAARHNLRLRPAHADFTIGSTQKKKNKKQKTRLVSHSASVSTFLASQGCRASLRVGSYTKQSSCPFVFFGHRASPARATKRPRHSRFRTTRRFPPYSGEGAFPPLAHHRAVALSPRWLQSTEPLSS